MKVLAVSGSLRRQSLNTLILRAAQSAGTPDMTVHLYEGIGALPHFNPDLEVHGTTLQILELRALFAEADAVLFSTPEYAHGMPGSLKNALDWLVGSGELYGKPVMLIHTAVRAQHARSQLREVLRTMGANLVDGAELDLDLAGNTEPLPSEDPELLRLLRQRLRVLSEAVRVQDKRVFQGEQDEPGSKTSS